MFIPEPMMDDEPILTENKEDSVSDNLITKASRSKLYPIPKLMKDVESVLTEEKEGSVSDVLITEESQVTSDPGEESAMKIINVSGSKDLAVKNKDDEKVSGSKDEGKVDGETADKEAVDDGVPEDGDITDGEVEDDGTTDGEKADEETEDDVAEVDSGEGESDVETFISKYSRSGVAGDQCDVVVYDRGKLKDHRRRIHGKGHCDVKQVRARGCERGRRIRDDRHEIKKREEKTRREHVTHVTLGVQSLCVIM